MSKSRRSSIANGTVPPSVPEPLPTSKAFNKTNVIVLYAEPRLQTTINLSSDLSIRQAIAKGQKELESRLNRVKGFPEIQIDPDCTDFYPASSPDAKLSDLRGLKTIVCWPKGQGDNTPSPLYEMIQSHSDYNEKTLAHSSDYGTPLKSDPNTLLGRLAALENHNMLQEELRKGMAARITNLEKELLTFQATASGLEKGQKDLQNEIYRVQDKLTLTMSAVLGDAEAVTKVRLGVLCERARHQLAQICGFDDWRQFEAETADNNDIFNTATRQIRRSDVSEQWKTLGSSVTALWALITPDPSLFTIETEPLSGGMEITTIGQSLLGMPDDLLREDWTRVYRAVYEAEPGDYAF